MEINTFSPPNNSSPGNPINISTERAESPKENPKRDLTLKCKGQTIMGKQCQQYVGALGQNGYCHFHLHLSNPNPKPTTPKATTTKSATPKPTAKVSSGEPTPPPSGNKKEKRETPLKCKGQSQDGKKCEQYVGMLGRNGYCHFHLYQEELDYAPGGVSSRKGRDRELAEGPQQTAQVKNYLDHQLLRQEGLGANQEMFNEQHSNDQPLNQQLLGQEVLNQQILNKQPLNQEILNQQILTKEGLNLPYLEILGYHPLNQHPPTQETLMNHPLNPYRINSNIPASFWNLYGSPTTGQVTVEEHLSLVKRPVALSASANKRDNDQDPPAILKENGREGREVEESREVLGMNSGSIDPVLPVYYPELTPVFCPNCFGRRYADEEELWGFADGFACPVTRDTVFTVCPEAMGANRRYRPL